MECNSARQANRGLTVGPNLSGYLILRTFDNDSAKRTAGKLAQRRPLDRRRVIPFFDVWLPEFRAFAARYDGLFVSACARNVEVSGQEEI